MICFWSPIERAPQRGRLLLPECRIESRRLPHEGEHIQVCAPSRAYGASVLRVGDGAFDFSFDDSGAASEIRTFEESEAHARQATFAQRARMTALDWIERILERRASAEWPALSRPDWRWMSDLEHRLPEIAGEWARFQAKKLDRVPALEQEPSYYTSGGRWKVVPLRIGRRVTVRRSDFPRTLRTLERIPGLLSATISALEPGARIHPHRGSFPGVLRYHVGLRVPRGRCVLGAADRETTWSGEGFVLDDTYVHWIHNDTDEWRVVLLVDVVKPMPWLETQLARVSTRLMYEP
jgi:beta-hydroxylase